MSDQSSNRLINALFNSTIKIKELSHRVRNKALIAANSLRLNGRTLDQVVNDITPAIDQHVVLRGNVHGDTLESLNIPSEEEVIERTDQILTSDILPISTFGTQNYLLPGVSGSFEGSTTHTQNYTSPMCLEADNTLMILRRGTNGAKTRIYYSYIPNATNPSRFNDQINTNKVYHPSFIPEGHIVHNFVGFGDGVLHGLVSNVETEQVTHTFYVLTNNTFDDRAHSGVLFNVADDKYHQCDHLFIHDSWVYRIYRRRNGINTGNQAILEIDRRPLSDLRGETNVGWEVVTNIETVGFDGHTYIDDGIRLGDGTWGSTDPNVNSVIHLDGDLANLGSSNISHSNPIGVFTTVTSDNAIKIRISGYTYFTNGVLSNRTSVLLSLTFNPNTNKAQLDPGLEGTNIITKDEDGVHYTGPLFVSSSKVGHDGFTNGVNSNLVVDSGYLFFYNIGNSQTYIYRASINNFISLEYNLQYLNASHSTRTKHITQDEFGSAVGNEQYGAFFLDENTIITRTDGRRSDGSSYRGFAVSKLSGGSEDYVHGSIYNGTVLGYKPSTNRDMLVDLGVDDGLVLAPITEMVGDQYHVSGYSFLGTRSNYATRHKTIHADLTFSDETLTVSDEILDNIVDQVLAINPIEEEITARVATLHIPQTSSLPPYSCVTIVTENLVNLTAICEINLGDIENSRLQSVTIGKVSSYIRITNRLSISYTGLSNLSSLGAICIVEDDTKIIVGGTSYLATRSTGDTHYVFYSFLYSKIDGEFLFDETLTHSSSNQGNTAGSRYVVNKELGLCRLVNSSDATDQRNKTLAYPIPKENLTIDNFNPSIQGPVNLWRVLLTSELAQGWDVYFTDPQPVFIKGKAYTLPIMSIRLDQLVSDPSNKVFYIYVIYNNANPTYSISLDKLADTEERMYIGTVETGDSAISSIVADKVYRINTHRISNTARGSSIPVTSGHPHLANRLDW